MIVAPTVSPETGAGSEAWGHSAPEEKYYLTKMTKKSANGALLGIIRSISPRRSISPHSTFTQIVPDRPGLLGPFCT